MTTATDIHDFDRAEERAEALGFTLRYNGLFRFELQYKTDARVKSGGLKDLAEVNGWLHGWEACAKAKGLALNVNV